MPLADRSRRTTDTLFQELVAVAPHKRTPAFAELLGRGIRAPEIVHIRQNLIACRSPNRGATGTGQPKKGLTRCHEPTCPSCQAWTGKSVAKRLSALIQAAAPSPDPDRIAFASIDAEDRDLASFSSRIRKLMRRLALKYVGVFSVSLNGKLHAHLTVLHPSLTREELDEELKLEFGEHPAVLCKRFLRAENGLDQDVHEEVRNVLQYGHVPVKKKDLVRQQNLNNPDALVQFVLWDQEVIGARKTEGGFTKAEKELAGNILMRRRQRIRKLKKNQYRASDGARTKAIMDKFRSFKNAVVGKKVYGDLRQLGPVPEVVVDTEQKEQLDTWPTSNPSSASVTTSSEKVSSNPNRAVADADNSPSSRSWQYYRAGLLKRLSLVGMIHEIRNDEEGE